MKRDRRVHLGHPRSLFLTRPGEVYTEYVSGPEAWKPIQGRSQALYLRGCGDRRVGDEEYEVRPSALLRKRSRDHSNI